MQLFGYFYLDLFVTQVMKIDISVKPFNGWKKKSKNSTTSFKQIINLKNFLKMNK